MGQHLGGDRPRHQITQSAVTMRAHDHQIKIFCIGHFGDGFSWVAKFPAAGRIQAMSSQKLEARCQNFFSFFFVVFACKVRAYC